MEVDEEVLKSSERKKRISIEKLQNERSETIIPAREREGSSSSSPTSRRETGC